MALIEITIDDRDVLAALRDLADRAADLSPALREIGEELVDSTKARFQSSTAPDGTRWAPNSQVTYLRYLAGQSGSYGKSGKLSAKGAARTMAKKPLVRDGFLADTIHYQLDGNTLLVGSPQKYAAMQQFGGSKSAFPHLWGDIPARPFLGLSDADRATVLDVLSDYLAP